MNTERDESRSKRNSITLCICTMNRPDELSRCLDSVFQSVEQPDEVIVSDDSPDGQPTQAVAARYPDVIYQHGPRRGLGPNRNACIRRARGSHIIFIDDDVRVSPEFFSVAQQLIASSDSKTIITGYEMNYRKGKPDKFTPHNSDFWGLQRVPIQNEYRAIVINATIFPRTLFEQVLFDERLRYGSEEIDVAKHAVALGYRIVYQDNLYVSHYPSLVNREEYKRFFHASRLYATAKAYWQYEHSMFKTLAFVLLAPLQLAGSAARRGNLKGVWEAVQATLLAYRYWFTVPNTTQPRDVES